MIGMEHPGGTNRSTPSVSNFGQLKGEKFLILCKGAYIFHRKLVIIKLTTTNSMKNMYKKGRYENRGRIEDRVGFQECQLFQVVARREGMGR